MKKFAIISPLLPPTNSGQPLVLYSLLKNFSPEDYCLISEADYSDNINGRHSEKKLNCKYFCIKLFFKKYYLNRLMEKMILKFNFLLPEKFLKNLIKKRVACIEKILVDEKCEVAIACTGSIFDPVATYYAAKNLGIKFIFYVFDMYSQQFIFQEGMAFTKKYEKILVNNSDKLILTNEFVCNEYLSDYGVKGVIIHNPVPLELKKEPVNFKNSVFNSNDIEIFYAGSIYAAHYDAFRNLVGALKKINKGKSRLITSQREFVLRIKGIKGPVIYEKIKSQSEVFELQRKTDILFLPLAFNSPYPKLINNSSPGKMGEYLASGKPVLVHAPKDSFLSWYFREYNCGIVADKADPDYLAKKIGEIIDDNDLREEIVNNALKCADRDFSAISGYDTLKYVINS